MSDFIGRVAARAVGERAAAWPRMPSLFESQGTTGDQELEVIDEEVVAPTPAPAPREVPSAARDVGRAAPGLEGRAAPTADGAAPADADTSPAPEQPQQSVPPQARPAREPPAPGRVDALQPEARPRTRRESAAPAVAVAALPVTPAVPAVTGTRAPAVPAPAPVAPAEQPSVRVHIGRLEVRANLREPAREQPRREPSPPPELSLADYLRGRREVG